MFSFENQVAIVTGGTRGIGKGITEAFLKNGATVIATYVSSDEKANAFKESLGEYSEKLFLEKFDVGDYKACEAFFKKIEEKFSKVQILINNSGIRKDNMLALMPEAEWDMVINTNLKGTYNMSKLATLHFMSHRYGRIVNISSVGGSLGLPGQANYAASKAGQVALSKSLSKEVGKRNITINNVLPGFIETELLSDLSDELVKEYKKQVPMKRFGKVEEVANAVMFLASSEASYISGACLEVSGGL